MSKQEQAALKLMSIVEADEHLLWSHLAHDQLHKVLIRYGKGQVWLALWSTLLDTARTWREVQGPLLAIDVKDYFALRNIIKVSIPAVTEIDCSQRTVRAGSGWSINFLQRASTTVDGHHRCSCELEGA